MTSTKVRTGAILAGALLSLSALYLLFHSISVRSRSRLAPKGLERVLWPKGKHYSAEKVELGRNLFYDPRLSSDGSVSCATCHDPRFAFSIPRSAGVGVGRHRGHRKPPSIINAAFSPAYFWDWRAATLEDQALGPLLNPEEMGNTPERLVSEIAAIPGYRRLFGKAFGAGPVTREHILDALAAFERTLLSGNSAYDRWIAGDRDAVTPEQVRGIGVFRESRCGSCHEGKVFTNGMMANIGIGMDRPHPDTGRFEITQDPADWGLFKTPGLRDVALRAPYMHDGSLHSLCEVVEYYNRGGIPNRNLDNRIQPLRLSPSQKSELLSFLQALDGEGWQSATAPERLPE